MKITRPSTFNEPVLKDAYKFIGNLVAAFVSIKTGNWTGLTKALLDAGGELSFSKPEDSIWKLLTTASFNSIFHVADVRLELMVVDGKKIESISQCVGWDSVYDNVCSVFEGVDVGEEIFRNPLGLEFVGSLESVLKEFLIRQGMSDVQADAAVLTYPSAFLFALNDAWAECSEQYALIYNEIVKGSPYKELSDRELKWQRYHASLLNAVEEPMFEESFGLSAVYIPLWGYWEKKMLNEGGDDIKARGHHGTERRLVGIDRVIGEWLGGAVSGDDIRILCGSPGCGKSSIAKMFAANAVRNGVRRVLFIPLHRIRVMTQLALSVDDYMQSVGLPVENPLRPGTFDGDVLVIFDGLDELFMQGKIGADAARDFISELRHCLSTCNHTRQRLKALVTGRDLAIAPFEHLYNNDRIIHALPYSFQCDGVEGCSAGEGDVDQRVLWWSKYEKAKGYKVINSIEQIVSPLLEDITSQPLLNYLLALSIERGLKIDETTNVNIIYDKLLSDVWLRKWGDRQHLCAEDFNEDTFRRILEEVALAAWHGNSRTATVLEIQDHIKQAKIETLFSRFQEGLEKGVTRLLLAFYFRSNGIDAKGYETFEFTHKSFGEFLIAKRLLRGIARIHNKFTEKTGDPEDQWDVSRCFEEWIKLCGSSALDEHVFGFLSREIDRQSQDVVLRWRDTFGVLVNNSRLLGNCGKGGFWELAESVNNARESLFVIAMKISEKSKIPLLVRDFDTPLSTILNSMYDYSVVYESISRRFFSCLSVENYFGFAEMFNCNALAVTFESATVEFVCLRMAILRNLGVLNSRFYQVDFAFSDFCDLNVTGSRFSLCDFSLSAVSKSEFVEARITSCAMTRNKIRNVVFRNCRFRFVNFSGSMFDGCTFENCIFISCIFDSSEFNSCVIGSAFFIRCSFFKMRYMGCKLDKFLCDEFSSSSLTRYTNYSYDSVGKQRLIVYSLPRKS